MDDNTNESVYSILNRSIALDCTGFGEYNLCLGAHMANDLNWDRMEGEE